MIMEVSQRMQLLVVDQVEIFIPWMNSLIGRRNQRLEKEKG